MFPVLCCYHALQCNEYDALKLMQAVKFTTTFYYSLPDIPATFIYLLFRSPLP